MDDQVKLKLYEFFSNFPKAVYKKGEIIIRPSDTLSNIYLLKGGNVRQYLDTEDGDEITIHIFTPNSFFPMMLIVSSSDNKFYFEAVTKVELYRAPTKKVVEFVKNNLDVLFDLTRRFALGLNGLSLRLESLMFENAYKRVCLLLNYLAGKFGEEKNGQTVINLPLTHKDIAAWVNLTRETVSRQIEKLEKEDIIRYSNHLIVIKDLSKLQKSL